MRPIGKKFQAWASTVPETICNPLYHWTAMELKRPFGVTKPLSGATAKEIFDACKSAVARRRSDTQSILRHFRVAVACTTDDPPIRSKRTANLPVAPIPIRASTPPGGPIKALAVSDVPAWNAWIDRLEADGKHFDIPAGRSFFLPSNRVTQHFITGLPRVRSRAGPHGCGALHRAEATASFDKLRSGKAIGADDAAKFRSALLYRMALLGSTPAAGCSNSISAHCEAPTRACAVSLDPIRGFDSIGDSIRAAVCSSFSIRSILPTSWRRRSSITSIHPIIRSSRRMVGNYQDGSVPGKMQWGSAWCFLDQLDGMEAQMRNALKHGSAGAVSSHGHRFAQLPSYPRHDYFRRLVCRMLGEDVRRACCRMTKNCSANW